MSGESSMSAMSKVSARNRDISRKDGVSKTRFRWNERPRMVHTMHSSRSRNTYSGLSMASSMREHSSSSESLTEHGLNSHSSRYEPTHSAMVKHDGDGAPRVILNGVTHFCSILAKRLTGLLATRTSAPLKLAGGGGSAVSSSQETAEDSDSACTSKSYARDQQAMRATPHAMSIQHENLNVCSLLACLPSILKQDMTLCAFLFLATVLLAMILTTIPKINLYRTNDATAFGDTEDSSTYSFFSSNVASRRLKEWAGIAGNDGPGIWTYSRK